MVASTFGKRVQTVIRRDESTRNKKTQAAAADAAVELITAAEASARLDRPARPPAQLSR